MAPPTDRVLERGVAADGEPKAFAQGRAPAASDPALDAGSLQPPADQRRETGGADIGVATVRWATDQHPLPANCLNAAAGAHDRLKLRRAKLAGELGR